MILFSFSCIALSLPKNLTEMQIFTNWQFSHLNHNVNYVTGTKIRKMFVVFFFWFARAQYEINHKYIYDFFF